MFGDFGAAEFIAEGGKGIVGWVGWGGGGGGGMMMAATLTARAHFLAVGCVFGKLAPS